MSPSQFPSVPQILKHAGLTCRVHERRPCDLPSTCQPTSAWGRKDARWRATIHDISVTGVSLLVARRFETGAGLAVELPATEGKDAYIVLAKVNRATQVAGGSWLLGCTFISELSDDEMERLLAPLVPADSAPDRQAPTTVPPIAPSRVAEAATPTTAPSNPAPPKIVLRDVSFHLETRPGVFLRWRVKHLKVPDNWPLAPGKQFTLWGNAANGRRPMFKVVVVRCAEHAERWRVRCRLAEPVNADVLAALGQFTVKQ
jgi:hypothetical protein